MAKIFKLHITTGWTGLFVLIFIFLVMLPSCAGPEDTPDIPVTPQPGDTKLTMDITPDTLMLSADEGSAGTFTVKFNRSTSFYAKADKDWCTLTDADGSGKTTYTVKAGTTANTDKTQRMAKVSFFSGEVTKYAYVFQEAAKQEATITITPDTLFLGEVLGSKGTVTVHLIDNSPYDAGGTESFGREIKEEENGTVLKITYTNIKERTSEIAVKCGVSQKGISKFYTVVQRAKQKEEQDKDTYNITITPDTHDIDAAGGQLFSLIEVDRETPVTVTSDAVWCIPADGGFDNPSTGFKLYMDVYPNTGNDTRTANVTVKAGGSSRTCTITQQGGYTGKLNIGGTIAEAVDLGLSVKWASHNLGASEESDEGAYLAWGEIDEKKEYTEESYKYYNTTYATFTDIGGNIGGTAYDAARVHWGDDWRMPTKEEFDELYKKCTWSWVRVDDTNGYKVTGPNGKSIFFPAAGISYFYHGTHVLLWSSTVVEKNISLAWCIFSSSTNMAYTHMERKYGVPIRPVTKSGGSSNNSQGTAGGGYVYAE